MRVIYDKVRDGIRILRWFSYDGQVEIPEQICGHTVRELGPYVFSQTVRRVMPGEKFQADLGWEEDKDVLQDFEQPAGEELLQAGSFEDGTPAMQGDMLLSLSLPSGLRKIGAYAFYNCGELKRLRFWGHIQDLGAGLFTGCGGIGYLDIILPLKGKSCFKEVLAELRQTLRVTCLDEKGEISAKLLFPEYYEESIENTPARILTQEMHGCGHRYRNAFNGTEFQYLTYDKLFPHIQVQEKPELAAELVLGRLMYPLQLDPARREIYEAYAAEHGRELFQAAKEGKDGKALRFASGAPWCSMACLDDMIEEGRRRGNALALGILMEARRKKGGVQQSMEGKKRRFTL